MFRVVGKDYDGLISIGVDTGTARLAFTLTFNRVVQ